MRSRREVRCSHCGGIGHNRAGCQVLKDYIEDRRAMYGDDDFRVRSYDAKKSRRKASSANRKCSWCGGADHTRRSCSGYKTAEATYVAKNAEYRRNLVQAMIDTGFGPGALIRRLPLSRWDDPNDPRWTKVFMISDLKWDQVHFHQRWHPIVNFRALDRLGVKASWVPWNGGGETAFPSFNEQGQVDIGRTQDYEILIPASEKSVRAVIPSDFLAGKSGIKEHLGAKNNSFHNEKWGKIEWSRWSTDPKLHMQLR